MNFHKIPYNRPIQMIINDNVTTHATGINEISRPLREKLDYIHNTFRKIRF